MRYDRMVEDALRGVVRNALNLARTEGLSGEHHFYLTFVSKHPRVSMPEYLREQYPDEMTIVLQHQFYDLDVDEVGFSVTLSFNSKRERLSIPFDAITTFADPSVNFALHFQKTGSAEMRGKEPEEPMPVIGASEEDAPVEFAPPKLLDAKVSGQVAQADGDSGDSSPAGKPEKVVILDHFRNNKDS